MFSIKHWFWIYLFLQFTSVLKEKSLTILQQVGLGLRHYSFITMVSAHRDWLSHKEIQWLKAVMWLVNKALMTQVDCDVFSNGRAIHPRNLEARIPETSRQTCWSKLELNTARQWPSRSRFGYPCCRPTRWATVSLLHCHTHGPVYVKQT